MTCPAFKVAEAGTEHTVLRMGFSIDIQWMYYHQSETLHSPGNIYNLKIRDFAGKKEGRTFQVTRPPYGFFGESRYEPGLGDFKGR